MGLRTLGDIDGYDRSAKGNAWAATTLDYPAITFQPALVSPARSFMQLCIFATVTHVACRAVGVFLIRCDHKVLFLRLNAYA